MPPVMVMVRVFCWLDCWWCWCFRWCGCCRWWFWVRVVGWRRCNALGVTWSLGGVGSMLARLSQVSCWLLGLLVLPMVSPLVPGVSAGEGVVAFGFGCWWRCRCGCRSYWSWVWAWLVGCCWVWALATPG